MSAKLTKWFDAHLAPARPGVYIREIGIRDVDYAYWTGKEWWMVHSTPADAARAQRNSGLQIGLIRWRGLAADPSKA